jgi:hypothetical protein
VEGPTHEIRIYSLYGSESWLDCRRRIARRSKPITRWMRSSTLWGDKAGAHSKGCNTDQHLQAWGNTRGMTQSSLSLDDVQVMINSALERQAKSSNEMMRRLIWERDGKKFVDPNAHASSSSRGVNFAQTNHQSSGTSHPNPPAQPMNHFYSRWTTSIAEPPLMIQLLLVGCHNRLWPESWWQGERRSCIVS